MVEIQLTRSLLLLLALCSQAAWEKTIVREDISEVWGCFILRNQDKLCRRKCCCLVTARTTSLVQFRYTSMCVNSEQGRRSRRATIQMHVVTHPERSQAKWFSLTYERQYCEYDLCGDAIEDEVLQRLVLVDEETDSGCKNQLRSNDAVHFLNEAPSQQILSLAQTWEQRRLFQRLRVFVCLCLHRISCHLAFTWYLFLDLAVNGTFGIHSVR